MNMGQEKYIEGIRRLRRYESKTLVKSHYAAIHNGHSLNTSKATSIVMSMKQGRELFESASKTEYMTRPIELYYGISAYCRAMTLLLNSNLSEEGLEQSHGIKFENIPLRVTDAESLLNIKLEFIDGAFTEWYQKSQEYFMLRVNSSEADWKYSYETDIIAKKVSLSELLNLIPEISSEMELLTATHQPRFMVTAYQNSIVSFDGKASQPQAKACFPGIESSRVTHLNNRNWTVDFSNLSDFVPQFAQLNEDGFGIGSTLLVAPPSAVRLSPLAAYFASAYSMSMLARYRPSIWGAIWNGGTADAAYPLLSQLMHTIHKWFPYMLSENLGKLNR